MEVSSGVRFLGFKSRLWRLLAISDQQIYRNWSKRGLVSQKGGGVPGEKKFQELLGAGN